MAAPALPAQAADTAGSVKPAESAGAADAADITDGLALWYKLDAASGSTVADASGHGRDATVSGTADWSGINQGLAFNGSDTYLKAPDDVLKGMDSISVPLDVMVDSAQSTPYFIYGFGNSSGSNGNGYLFTTGNSLRTSIAYGNGVTRSSAEPDVVSADGLVHRPAHDGGAKTVELTATVTKGAASTTRAFTAKVPELPKSEALKGYVFSYFTGAGRRRTAAARRPASGRTAPTPWARKRVAVIRASAVRAGSTYAGAGR